MSVMYCSNCGGPIDTDFDEYDFGNDLCESCSIEAKEIIQSVTKGQNVNEILKGNEDGS